MTDEATDGSPSEYGKAKTKDGERSHEYYNGHEARGLDYGKSISPSQSGEEIPAADFCNIFKFTENFLRFTQTKVDSQKIHNHSLTFMVMRIGDSLNYYMDYISQLNTFLVHSNIITGDYYARLCCDLPKYGDYVSTIKAEKEENVNAGGDQQVNKRKLLDLVLNVTDSYYWNGLGIRSLRAVCSDVNNTVPDRQTITDKFNKCMPNWMEIQNTLAGQLECINEHIFNITAKLNFFKYGEMKIGSFELLCDKYEPEILYDPSVKMKEPSVKSKEPPEKPLEPPEIPPEAQAKVEVEPSETSPEAPENHKDNEVPDAKVGQKIPEEDSDDDIFIPTKRIRQYKK